MTRFPWHKALALSFLVGLFTLIIPLHGQSPWAAKPAIVNGE